MARGIPLAENPTINPILSISLLITCLAATIAIVSSMCGIFSRRKSSSSDQDKSSDDQNASQSNEDAKGSDDPDHTSPNKEGDNSESEEAEKPLPPPPAALAGSYTNNKPLHTRASSYHFRSNSNVSLGKLTSTMSMKVQGGIKAIRQTSKRELDLIRRKDHKDSKHEDTLWQKRIILGEKCRVPSETEDDMAVFDENGHKISAYHKKPLASATMSRQSSNVDTSAIPKEEEKSAVSSD